MKPERRCNKEKPKDKRRNSRNAKKEQKKIEEKLKDYKPESKRNDKRGIPVKNNEKQNKRREIKLAEWWYDETKLVEAERKMEEQEISREQLIDDFYHNPSQLIDINNSFKEDDNVERIKYLKEIMKFARKFFSE
jgi:hypothetical protein